VPRSLYEAATVDGANAWHRFWNVTIPMCSPVILFNLIMGFIYGFQYFTLPWLLTEGGPNKATEVLLYSIYQEGFSFLRAGYGAALTVVFLAFVLLLTLVQILWSERHVHYA